MGSKFFFKTAEEYYILGLWLADGYWRASSIGLTSVDMRLIDRFTLFLKDVSPQRALKKRIYSVDGMSKRKQTAVQVYINNRPLTRLFMSYKTGVISLSPRVFPAYLAGRIDGDGHVDTKHRSGIRIAYGTKYDAMRDQGIFGKDNVSLYEYKAAGTYVLYLKKHFRDLWMDALQKYSLKLAP